MILNRIKSMALIQNPEAFEKALLNTDPYPEIGWVDEVIGLVMESRGPQAKIGDLCYILSSDDSVKPLAAEVVGFKSGKLLLMPIGDMLAVGPGSRVINTGKPFSVAVGPDLVGRVVNGLGEPIDHKGAVSFTTK